MSVPDMIRNVTQRAKELPLHMLQTALSGMGQALLLGDRVRSKIKNTTGQEEEPGQALDRPVETGEEQAEKPARRAPVIFAPRPEKAAEKTATAESNGARTTPEPVIFSPAKPKPAKPAAPEAPVTVPAPEAAGTRPAEVTSEEATEETAKPPVSSAPAAAKPKPAKAPAEEVPAAEAPAAKTPAEEKAAEPKAPAEETPAAETPAAKTPEPAPADAVVETPPAVKVEVTKVETAKPESTDAAAVEVTGTRAAAPEVAEVAEVAEPVTEPAATPAEPLPGYAGLTVASLRARMRGRSADQIRELLAYERATSDREAVTRMYENRLVKLAAAE